MNVSRFLVDFATKRHLGLDRASPVAYSVQPAILLLHGKSTQVHGGGEWTGGGRGTATTAQNEER